MITSHVFSLIVSRIRKDFIDESLRVQIYTSFLKVCQETSYNFLLEEIVGTDAILDKAVLTIWPDYFDKFFADGLDPTEWDDSTPALLEAYGHYKAKTR